ncbi:NADPH:quinone reductase [Hoeflea poritis]|uniref:NADPH:quinone reductase n=1 Tax=Hoeflea poritis TaxID=2993659 RepID=A0ABT4VN64_9HYPH|nr:NADPH:quinone reductase [Hoeflea poritis]MDA4846156.1 NADPH:quinone reductase [Hoeflea poritis]
MRAAWYRQTGPASDVLETGSLPDDTAGPPGPGEVRVRIRASGINPADVKRRAGWGGLAMEHDCVVPHADGAGIVEAVGEDVSSSWQGQRVWMRNAQGGYGEAGRAFGTAAEYVSLPVAQVFALPEPLGFAQGACLGIPALTAYAAVFGDGPVTGNTVLVTGAAGAVGHFAAQFAHAGGARVIATVSSEEKAAHVRAVGVDDILFRHDEDIAARVMEMTGNDGVDRIVEVDFGANLGITRQIIRPHSVIAAYSSTAEPNPVLPYYDFAFRGATLRFIQGFLLTPRILEAAVAFIARLAGDGQLTVALARQLPLERIAEAHELVESGNAIGNVVLEIPN